MATVVRTNHALARPGDEPSEGPRPSLRRWLFFPDPSGIPSELFDVTDPA